MSRFTRNRKIARLKEQERIENLERGSKQIDAAMERTLKICDAIEKEHPEFDSLDAEERVKLWEEYYLKILNQK